MAVNISLEKLIDTGAHYGHQMRRWNPQMREYMHSVHEGVFVFDLIKTESLFSEALEFLTKASRDGKTVLILGTKKQAKDAVAKMAKNTGAFYVTERWLGGTFTNFIQVGKSIRKLADIKKNLSDGTYSNYTKKERLLISREAEKLERFVGGLTNMDKIPDIMIIVDTHREKSAVIEATRLGVTTIGIVDSNGNADDVMYPIPMNDDASAAVEYAISLFEEAILEGQGKSKVAEVTKSKEDKPKKEKKVTPKKAKVSETK